MKLHEIERVNEVLYRTSVPGGWIYETRNDDAWCATFVPDPAAPHVKEATDDDAGWVEFGKREPAADVRIIVRLDHVSAGTPAVSMGGTVILLDGVLHDAGPRAQWRLL